MKMTQEAWEKMQERIGLLISGKIPEPYRILKGMLTGEKVIAIGDVVAENMLKVGIEPEMIIVDGKSMRKDRVGTMECDITVENPASELTKELIAAVKKGYKRIFVEGEEDLAALPAILYADTNTVIVYGEPSEGIMVIRPTEENKQKVKEVLALFENGDMAQLLG
ncbi:MAG: DUF359 domain-containing protein [Theionarchaea archaeon]|nr:DUF359 domain-containing protein [Theionarchaea archaeon]MBU7038396.1 DUF359 domain-containing protein [Theionarchaea archaeon]